MDDAAHFTEGLGEQVVNLTNRWACRDPVCTSFRDGCCWVNDTLHFLLDGPERRVWATALTKGKGDINDPPRSLVTLL